MSSHVESRARLDRMLASARQVAAEIRSVEAQIRAAAESFAIRYVGGKTHCFGRHSTSWRPRHERAFQGHVAGACARRTPELEALRRKLRRQTEAIETMVARERFNLESWELRL